jgi:hypothetical protein
MRYLVPRALIVAALFGSGAPSLVAQRSPAGQPTDAPCARSVAIDEFKKVVLSRDGGTVDSVHVPGGIAVIVTARGGTGDTAAIQKAARDYLERVKGLGADKGTSACAELSRAMAAGKITETMAPFGAGALFMITSPDKKLEKLIQDNDCCQWCGPCGPYSTAGCCRRC